jgi:hypothetical protein
MNFERILLDEWLYIPLLATTMLWAFGAGWAIGTLIVYTL